MANERLDIKMTIQQLHQVINKFAFSSHCQPLYQTLVWVGLGFGCAARCQEVV
jgi:hypothetical protein